MRRGAISSREAEARGVAGARLVFASYVASGAEHLARLGLGRSLPRHAPVQRPFIGQRCAVGGRSGSDTAGRHVCRTRRREPASRLRASRADRGVDGLAYEAIALRLARDEAAHAALKAKLERNRNSCAALRHGALYATSRSRLRHDVGDITSAGGSLSPSA